MAPDHNKDWVQLYKTLEQNSASDPNAYRQQAAELLDKKDAPRSKLMLERHIHANPDDVDALILLAKTCLQLEGGLEEALVVARKSCNLATTPQLRQAAIQVLAVALGRKARSPTLTGSSKASCRQEAIQALQPEASTSQSSPAAAAAAHYNLSVLHAEAGDASKAADHAKAAMQASAGGASPELHTLSLVLLALLLSARGEVQAALSVLSASHQRSHGSSSSSLPTTSPQCEVLVARVRAQLLHTQGDVAAAMAVLAKVKKQVSAQAGAGEQEAKVWQELAQAFAAQGALADAFFCSDQSQQLLPWAASTHYVLGCVLEAAGRVEEATNAYNTALALDSCHAPSLLRLGTIHRRSGGVSQAAVARDLLTEALRYDPSHAEGWYQLGLACKAMHHRADAEQHLHTAVLLAASSPALPYSSLPLLLA